MSPPVEGPVCVGIIGRGLQAESWGASLAGHDTNGRLGAIWGGSRAGSLAQRFGPGTAASAAALVEDPAFHRVIVTTPNTSHPAYVRLALSAGRHLAVERPIAVSGRDVLAIAAVEGARRSAATGQPEPVATTL